MSKKRVLREMVEMLERESEDSLAIAMYNLDCATRWKEAARLAEAERDTARRERDDVIISLRHARQTLVVTWESYHHEHNEGRALKARAKSVSSR